MKQVTLIMMVFLCHYFTAQITVQNTQSPSQLVQNILLGSGILSSNITYNGNPVAAGALQHNVAQFNATGTNFPINNGLLLTTGYANIAPGPNNDMYSDTFLLNTYADVDLYSIASDTTTNGAILEFDFQAISDTFSFKYIFASEEYNEFVGSSFNDVFGFFLSGPGINGSFTNNGINLATLPSTNSISNIVSINNVNNNTNNNYYTDNEQSQAYGNAIQYDGTTILMSTGAKLQCGQTYHIKLCISNVGDQGFGSAVFIKSKSFSSEDLTFSMPNNFNGAILEDCPNGNHSIVLTRPESQDNNSLTINLTYAGTATSGTDYQALPSTMTFLANQDTISTPITITDDNINEGIEYILINTTYTNICGNVIAFEDTLFISDPIVVNIATSDYTYYCPKFNSHVTVSTGIAPYTYLWFDNSTNDSISISTPLPNQINNFIVTVTDACGNTDTDTSIITYLPVVSSFSADPIVSAKPSTVTFANNSQNALNYSWNFANGLTALANSNASQNSMYSDTGHYTIQLIAYNGGCTDTSYQTIMVADYPVVIPSNVFTPNGDGVNDEFYFNLKYVKNLSVTIFDRWGSVVYEEESAKPKWNGKDLKGNDLSDGVYFYLFTATGYIGDPVTGSGFLHLVKN